MEGFVGYGVSMKEETTSTAVKRNTLVSVFKKQHGDSLCVTLSVEDEKFLQK